jgi:hypothetical protein
MKEYKLTAEELNEIISQAYESGYYGWLDLKEAFTYDVIINLESKVIRYNLNEVCISSTPGGVNFEITPPTISGYVSIQGDYL